jgi:hypothetical protein
MTGTQMMLAFMCLVAGSFLWTCRKYTNDTRMAYVLGLGLGGAIGWLAGNL